MTDDLFAMIEKRRLQLETQLTAALEKRDIANSEIKAIRTELGDLPVRRVRRARKAAATKETGK